MLVRVRVLPPASLLDDLLVHLDLQILQEIVGEAQPLLLSLEVLDLVREVLRASLVLFYCQSL